MVTAAIKIPIKVVQFSGSGGEQIKEVLYDASLVAQKNIRDWENSGKPVKDRSVLFSTLKLSKDDDYIVVAMSKQQLIDLLVKHGIIKVVE